VLPKGAVKVLSKIAVAVPPKGALKVLPKTAVAVPPKGAPNWKFLWWKKNKRGALEVLPNANECYRSRSIL